MSVFHVKVTTAAAIAFATTVVGGLCALVPSWAPFQQAIIAALTAVIVAAGLGANAVHALAGAVNTTPAVSSPVRAAPAVQAELLADLAKVEDPTSTVEQSVTDEQEHASPPVTPAPAVQ